MKTWKDGIKTDLIGLTRKILILMLSFAYLIL